MVWGNRNKETRSSYHDWGQRYWPVCHNKKNLITSHSEEKESMLFVFCTSRIISEVGWLDWPEKRCFFLMIKHDWRQRYCPVSHNKKSVICRYRQDKKSTPCHVCLSCHEFLRTSRIISAVGCLDWLEKQVWRFLDGVRIALWFPPRVHLIFKTCTYYSV